MTLTDKLRELAAELLHDQGKAVVDKAFGNGKAASFVKEAVGELLGGDGASKIGVELFVGLGVFPGLNLPERVVVAVDVHDASHAGVASGIERPVKRVQLLGVVAFIRVASELDVLSCSFVKPTELALKRSTHSVDDEDGIRAVREGAFRVDRSFDGKGCGIVDPETWIKRVGGSRSRNGADRDDKEDKESNVHGQTFALTLRKRNGWTVV